MNKAFFWNSKITQSLYLHYIPGSHPRGTLYIMQQLSPIMRTEIGWAKAKPQGHPAIKAVFWKAVTSARLIWAPKTSAQVPHHSFQGCTQRGNVKGNRTHRPINSHGRILARQASTRSLHPGADTYFPHEASSLHEDMMCTHTFLYYEAICDKHHVSQ